MTLYFVHHKHDDATCPARDPRMGQMLLDHIQPANAAKFGVRVHGEAVLDGKHTFVLIVEAASVEPVEHFMQPFQQAGSVEISPASLCQEVVARAGC